MPARRRDSILEAMVVLREQAPDISVVQVMGFLYVAENPGLSMAELALVTGLHKPTISRAVRALATEDCPGGLAPHHGLISVDINPRDTKSRILGLTDKGRMLREKLDRIIRNAVCIDAAA